MPQIKPHHLWLSASAVLFLATCMWLVARLLPASADNMRQSTCFVDGHAQLCLVTGTDTLVLHVDSIHQQGVWINKHWWWPSCDGRVLTLCPTIRLALPADSVAKASPARIVALLTDSLARLRQRKHTEEKELQYYLRSHGVQDEGYTRIATYAAQQAKATALLDSAYNRLKALKLSPKSHLVRLGCYRLSWYDDNNRLVHANCKPYVATVRQEGLPVILRAVTAKKPWDAYAVRNVPWGIKASTHVLMATVAPTDTLAPARVLLVPGTYGRDGRHDVPRLLARNGAPVFTAGGRFVGIVKGKEVKR